MPRQDPPQTRDLKDLTLEDTEALARELGLPRFRGEQIFRWVHARRVESIDEMRNISKELRARLAELAALPRLTTDLEQVSADGTRKLRLAASDGALLETVLIPDGDGTELAEDTEEPADAASSDDDLAELAAAPIRFPRHPKLTQCVSSQVGCALDCAFCATATLGLRRNLTAGEIVDQVYRAQDLIAGLPETDVTRRAGAARITNLVFMGMGEPLHNYAEVVRAIRILTDEHGADFSWRRITVSTAGLVPAIERFAEEQVPANLAISLNATTDSVRDEIMPINRKWNIARLLEAARRVAASYDRRRRITFEYVLLGGVNDSLGDARRLVRLVRGIPCKINVIPWNPHPGAPYARSSDAEVAAFCDELRRLGAAVYVRRSRGRDIDAACGQLAARGSAGGLVQLGRPDTPK